MDKEKSASQFIINTARYILSIKIVVGFLLISIGIFAAITFIMLTYQIIVSPEKIMLLESVLKMPNGQIKIISDTRGYELFLSQTIVYYGISFFFLLVGTGLTAKIIKIGVGMIDKLELKYLIQKLIKEWDEEKKKKTEKPKSESTFFRKK